MTPMKRQKNVDTRNFYKFLYFTELLSYKKINNAYGKK